MNKKTAPSTENSLQSNNKTSTDKSNSASNSMLNAINPAPIHKSVGDFQVNSFPKLNLTPEQQYNSSPQQIPQPSLPSFQSLQYQDYSLNSPNSFQRDSHYPAMSNPSYEQVSPSRQSSLNQYSSNYITNHDSSDNRQYQKSSMLLQQPQIQNSMLISPYRNAISTEDYFQGAQHPQRLPSMSNLQQHQQHQQQSFYPKYTIPQQQAFYGQQQQQQLLPNLQEEYFLIQQQAQYLQQLQFQQLQLQQQALQSQYTQASPKRKYKLWTEEEDKKLLDLKRNQLLSWKDISLRFSDRTLHACQFRWRKISPFITDDNVIQIDREADVEDQMNGDDNSDGNSVFSENKENMAVESSNSKFSNILN